MSSPAPARPRRRWLLPAVSAALLAVGLGLSPLWQWAELHPAARTWVVQAGRGCVLASAVVLLAWFFRAGGLSGRVRLAGAVLLALLAGVAVGTIRGFDFYGDMGLIPRFRWESSPQDLFEASRRRPEPGEPRPIVLQSRDPELDSPRYRGPRGDGFLTPPDGELFSTDWSKAEPKVVWRRRCGGGYSGIAVAGNVAITLEQRRGKEALVCYDRDNGRENWAYSYDAHFTDVFGDGPRATPAIHAGRVYSLGATGVLVCVDGVNGELKWKTNVLGSKSPVTWGVSGSPLVVDEMVIVAVGGKGGPSLAAYDLAGNEKWTAGEPGGGYSSPTLATIGGRRQVVLFDSGGLAGFAIEDGEELWRHKWKTFQGMNIIQPIIWDDGRVFVSSEASNGSAMLQVTRTKEGFETRVLWETKELASKFSSPVAVGGAIYGLNMGPLVCLDERTGERLWSGGRYGHGQTLVAGGALIVVSERGAVSLVAANTKGYERLASMELLRDKTWNVPTLAGRRLFVRNAAEIACVELPRR